LGKRPFDIITFDCYGTLVDWETGISDAILAAGREDGHAFEREKVLSLYAEIEPQVQAEGFRPYREILAETVLQLADRRGWSLTRRRAGFLAESLPGWRPFPDTNPALERLTQAGYRLGILSNVDDDLLDGTCRHFRVPFALRVTAQQVGSYKPAHSHFVIARQQIGPDSWLHAAQSFFHDVRPAVQMEIPVAWINRNDEAAPSHHPGPTRTLANLTDLADWLVP
jgi:2-haloalkanoic acid dehalogenase type II